MLKIQGVFFTFYKGIVAYSLFRNGSGQHLLKEGNDALSKLQAWRQSCDWIENKVLLLQGEYFASAASRDAALVKYEESIKSARDNGFVHEQGLAHECMGNYLLSIVEIPEAKNSFMQAYEYYMQWGAKAKAEQLKKKHGLDPAVNSNGSTNKHDRTWDGY
jgi:hypothetical protein